VPIKTEAISAFCTRALPTVVSVAGEPFSKLEAATISVRTASYPFQINFSEEFNRPLPLTEAARLRAEVAALREELRVAKVDIQTQQEAVNILKGVNLPRIDQQISGLLSRQPTSGCKWKSGSGHFEVEFGKTFPTPPRVVLVSLRADYSGPAPPFGEVVTAIATDRFVVLTGEVWGHNVCWVAFP
jgi:hypothetical protein